jgi:hypothetical protein
MCPREIFGSTIHIPWWEILGVPRVSMWVRATCTGCGGGWGSIHVSLSIWFLIYILKYTFNNILSIPMFSFVCCVFILFAVQLCQTFAPPEKWVGYSIHSPMAPIRTQWRLSTFSLLSKYNFGKLLEIIIQFFKTDMYENFTSHC